MFSWVDRFESNIILESRTDEEQVDGNYVMHGYGDTVIIVYPNRDLRTSTDKVADGRVR
jgi:hypothetical protein